MLLLLIVVVVVVVIVVAVSAAATLATSVLLGFLSIVFVALAIAGVLAALFPAEVSGLEAVVVRFSVQLVVFVPTALFLTELVAGVVASAVSFLPVFTL